MKIYNMLLKRYVSNVDANMNCLLIFKDQKEILSQRGYYPRNLLKITEDKIQGIEIEDYLDGIELLLREPFQRRKERDIQ